jgi:hypothetical protein
MESNENKNVEADAVKTVAKSFTELVKNGINDFTFRTGNALDQPEPVRVDISGTIDAPKRWLEKRLPLCTVDPKTCHVIVNREQLSITLNCSENDPYGTTVKGQLEMSGQFERFGINKYNYITPMQMAELIKMNRSFFENRQVAMDLVTQLRNFKAKVDKDLENTDDTRGNRKQMINQVVDSNIPDAFTIIIPIFKGQKADEIECEVYINPDDLTCTLVSPAANDIIQETRDNLIDDVLKGIEGICPDIPIIEQ